MAEEDEFEFISDPITSSVVESHFSSATDTVEIDSSDEDDEETSMGGLTMVKNNLTVSLHADDESNAAEEEDDDDDEDEDDEEDADEEDEDEEDSTEARNAQLFADLTNLQDDLQAKLSTLDGSLAAFKALKKDHGKQSHRINQSQGKFQKELKSLESLKASLAEQRTKIKIDRGKLKNEMNDFEKTKREWKSEFDRMKKELETRADQFVTEKNDRQKELDGLVTVCDRLHKDNSELRKELRKLNDFCNKISKTVTESASRINLNAKGLNGMTSEMGGIKERLSGFETKLEQTSQRKSSMTLIKKPMALIKKTATTAAAANVSPKPVVLAKSLKPYACKECGTHIAIEDDVESRCYQVGQGAFTEKKRGYLFKKCVNLKMGVTKTENFTTGSYEISWVNCIECNQSLGWKYLSSDKPENGGKVGKYCVARYSLTNPTERGDKIN